ncbi:MAG: CopD family protein, partial [Acetobacteraceae bacterium]
MTVEGLLPFFRVTLALHVISMVLWMAGMLTLPWLYVEHAGIAARGADGAWFQAVERRLMKRAINPCMYLTWLFGILLVLTPGAMSWSAGWWWVKLIAVLLMSGFHGILSKWRRDFRDGRDVRTPRFYRRVAGVPLVLLII